MGDDISRGNWTLNIRESNVHPTEKGGELKPKPVHWTKPVFVLYLHHHTVKTRIRSYLTIKRNEKTRRRNNPFFLYGSDQHSLLCTLSHFTGVGSVLNWPTEGWSGVYVLTRDYSRRLESKSRYFYFLISKFGDSIPIKQYVVQSIVIDYPLYHIIKTDPTSFHLQHIGL